MKFVKNMFKHAHEPLRSNGTYGIHASTFHLFLRLIYCSFEPLTITTFSDVL
jgi:hypothetical protein